MSCAEVYAKYEKLLFPGMLRDHANEIRQLLSGKEYLLGKASKEVLLEKKAIRREGLVTKNARDTVFYVIMRLQLLRKRIGTAAISPYLVSLFYIASTPYEHQYELTQDDYLVLRAKSKVDFNIKTMEYYMYMHIIVNINWCNLLNSLHCSNLYQTYLILDTNLDEMVNDQTISQVKEYVDAMPNIVTTEESRLNMQTVANDLGIYMPEPLETIQKRYYKIYNELISTVGNVKFKDYY